MEITIYSTTTCSFCHALTNWLDSNNFTYKKVMTDEDEEGMVEFMKVNDGFIGVPFTVVKTPSGEIKKVSGYDLSKLQQALNAA